MLIPNPILLDMTPAGGLTLPVTAERGGLAGYILLGQLGPPAMAQVSADGGASWQAVTYPHALAAGETLRLSRTATSAALTILRALAPVDDEPPPEMVVPAPGPTDSGAMDLTPYLQQSSARPNGDIEATYNVAALPAPPQGYTWQFVLATHNGILEPNNIPTVSSAAELTLGQIGFSPDENVPNAYAVIRPGWSLWVKPISL